MVGFQESSCRRIACPGLDPGQASIFIVVTLPRLDTGFRRYDSMFVPHPSGFFDERKVMNTSWQRALLPPDKLYPDKFSPA
jgi:hypothetical protein